jgi:hypothetical protein
MASGSWWLNEILVYLFYSSIFQYHPPFVLIQQVDSRTTFQIIQFILQYSGALIIAIDHEAGI